MPYRTISVEGATWRVAPSGCVTQYTRDEFTLLFTCGEGTARVHRAVRYSPRGARSREASFAELGDDELKALFAQSQPGVTSPEANYSR